VEARSSTSSTVGVKKTSVVSEITTTSYKQSTQQSTQQSAQHLPTQSSIVTKRATSTNKTSQGYSQTQAVKQ
jgi:hypothetical protein